MKNVLFITGYPAPYMVDFFNLLGAYSDVNLTVAFMQEINDQNHRSKEWFVEQYDSFIPIFVSRTIKIGKFLLYPDLLKLVNKEQWDEIIFGIYHEVGTILAQLKLRLHKKPYSIEIDGGVADKKRNIKNLLKKYLISHADKWYSNGRYSTEYFEYYGAKAELIYFYPFTSLFKNDFAEAEKMRKNDKIYYRNLLGMTENRILITVGRFSYRNGYGKGFDILMRLAETKLKGIGIYIIGDEPTEEFVKWKAENQLHNIHFVEFKKKEELALYYNAADVFCLLSRKDAWGLVINEAMMFGLPIVGSDKCGAVLDLIENGKNGYIVSLDKENEIADAITKIFKDADIRDCMKVNNISKIEKYTLENMASYHRDIIMKGYSK